MKTYYNIAGCAIEVSGGDLENFPGFAVFQVAAPEVQPLLYLGLDETVVDSDMAPFTGNFYDTTIGEGGPVCEFLDDGSRYLLRVIEESGRRWLLEIKQEGDHFVARSNMGNDRASYGFLHFPVWVAFGVAALSKQVVAIHASTIQSGGGSILFLGESGTGKSTHTRLWLQHIPNTSLLNDDSPFIGVYNGEITIYGSPWSGKTPCYKNESTPGIAFVRLRQAPYNKIVRLKGLEAIGGLLPSLPPAFASHPVLEAQVHKIMACILNRMPVYRLDCLPDSGAAQLVYDTLKEDGYL